MKRMWIALMMLALAGFPLAAPAQDQDVEGSADPDLIGRFEGAVITYYRAVALDEAALLQAPQDYSLDPAGDRLGPSWLQLEGRVTQVRYHIPTGHSSLEVIRAYQTVLAGRGFSPVFSCTNRDCFAAAPNDPYLMGELIDTRNGSSTAYFDKARYVLLSNAPPPQDFGPSAAESSLEDMAEGGPGSEGASESEGGPGSEGTGAPSPFDFGPADVATTYVSVLVGESGPETTAYIEIVETEGPAPFAEPPMPGPDSMPPDDMGGPGGMAGPGDMASLESMTDDLDEGRAVNVYGLVFDFDSDTLLPGSTPTLEQIAQLLMERPGLGLTIVGHTDNLGDADYNLDLSQRRAESVVAALTGLYGIAADRLMAFGQGMSQPVAGNDTEEGRAQNRRVELIPSQN